LKQRTNKVKDKKKPRKQKQQQKNPPLETEPLKKEERLVEGY